MLNSDMRRLLSFFYPRESGVLHYARTPSSPAMQRKGEKGTTHAYFERGSLPKEEGAEGNFIYGIAIK